MTWSLALVEKRLQIDYRITSALAKSILLVDRLLWQHAANPDVIIVRNDSSPNTVAFTRAFVRTKELLLSTPYPTVRTIDPGETVEGRAFVAWPLFAWHNFSRVDELAPGATHAVLEVGYIDAPGVALEAITLPEGVVYTASKFASQKLLRGEPIQLPR
jgi:hypothetical protein